MARLFKRPQPSWDLEIKEIPPENIRVKLIAHVVSISGNSLIINDGTGQIMTTLGKFPSSQFSIGALYRFILDIKKIENQVVNNIILSQEITKDQVNQYKRLVKLERRIPK